MTLNIYGGLEIYHTTNEKQASKTLKLQNPRIL